jgi:hypothetical protein
LLTRVIHARNFAHLQIEEAMTVSNVNNSDALAATIAEALHRHVPDFQGIFYEQLLAVSRDVMAVHGSMLPTRSSAPQVGGQRLDASTLRTAARRIEAETAPPHQTASQRA